MRTFYKAYYWTHKKDSTWKHPHGGGGARIEDEKDPPFFKNSPLK
jgi:hypothetical protein